MWLLRSYLFILVVDELAISDSKPPTSPNAAHSEIAMDAAQATPDARGNSVAQNARASRRIVRDATVSLRSVQPLCLNIRASFAASSADIAEPLRAEFERPDALGPVKLLYVNKCNFAFQA